MSRYRLTLIDNDRTLNLVLANPPVNLKEVIPSLRKDTIYGGNFEMISLPEIQYVKEAKAFIDEVLSLNGTEADVELLFEILNSSNLYEELFRAKHNFGTTEKGYISNYKVTSLPLRQTGFHIDFKANDETELDLQKLTDLKGGAITPFTNETILVNLDAQLLRKIFKAETDVPTFPSVQPHREITNSDFEFSAGSGETQEFWQVFDFNEEPLTRDERELKGYIADPILEITDVKSLTNKLTYTDAAAYASEEHWIKFDDHATIDIKIRLAFNMRVNLNDTGPDGNLVGKYYYRLNNDTPTLIATRTMTKNNGIGSKEWRIIIKETISSLTVRPGDRLFLYGAYSFVFGGATNVDIRLNAYTTTGTPKVPAEQTDDTLSFDGNTNSTMYASIIADTDYGETPCRGMLIYEVFLRMLQQMTGRNDPLRSNVFGRTDSEVHTYGVDGDYSGYLITNGYQISQFPIDEQPITAEFQKFFQDIRAIFNVELGIIVSGGTEYISIEKAEDFRDSSTVLFRLENVDKIVERVSTDNTYSSVEVGYSKWEDEAFSSLDTPHSTRVYKTPINTQKKPYKAISSIIAAGTSIELKRRDPFSIRERKDNKTDRDLHIISLKRSGGGGWERKKDTDFANSFGNLLNAETVYNLDITPRMNLERHANVFTAGLMRYYSSKTLQFVSGTANFKAIIDTVLENRNYTVTTLDDPLVENREYEFEYPFTLTQLGEARDNPYQVIEATDRMGNLYRGFIDPSVEPRDIKTGRTRFLLKKVY